MFQAANDESAARISDFGIALLVVDGHAKHVGITYKDNENVLMIAHLRFHGLFRNEKLQYENFYLESAQCVSNKARRIDLHGRLIAMQDRQNIPYAFRFDSQCFDAQLKAKAFPSGYGLTCASFVISVFHSRGIKVSDLSTWAIRQDDIVWEKEFTETLRERVGSDYAEAVAKFIPNIRVRPAEAAACVISAQIPLSFSAAEARAAEIVAHIAKTKIGSHLENNGA